MKRIGLVDDDLDNFHANTYLAAWHGPLAARGWAVTGAASLRKDGGVAWCQRNGVAYFPDAATLAREVDCVAVLAPSSPDTHLELCRQVVPEGKPTFVDKTFAPDTATGEVIFRLADEAGAPIQSTSALRSTNVQQRVRELGDRLLGMAVWAGGASFDEYGVHPVELVVSCMGPGVASVHAAGDPRRPALLLGFADGRTATIAFDSSSVVPFAATLWTPSGAEWTPVDEARLFIDAAAAILDFFDLGRPLIPRQETLTVLRVLDAVRDPQSRATLRPV